MHAIITFPFIVLFFVLVRCIDLASQHARSEPRLIAYVILYILVAALSIIGMLLLLGVF